MLLLLVALAALAAQWAFPFISEAPWALRTAVTVVGVVRVLAGVALWFRGPSATRRKP